MPENAPEALAWRMARLEETLRDQNQRHEREIAGLESDIRTLREKAESRERNLYIVGLGFLFSLVGTLFAVLWANLGAIFPGRG